MRKYWTFFRIRFLGGLQYRIAALAGVATQFAWGGLSLLLYAAFYRANPDAFPMTYPAFSTYIWLQQAFLAFFMTWYYDAALLSSIQDGTVAYELTRPIDLYGMWFTRCIAVRASRTVLRCLPVLLIASLLPYPYGIGLPADFLHAVLFLLTMLLGVCCLTAFNMLVYITCFYTVNPTGVRMAAASIADFCTGSVVPLPFLPDTMRRMLEWTPFGVMQNVPYRVYSGDLAGGEMWRLVLMQVIWTAGMVIVGRLWMRRSLRRVAVMGG